jgi:hypothetical protein
VVTSLSAGNSSGLAVNTATGELLDEAGAAEQASAELVDTTAASAAGGAT